MSVLSSSGPGEFVAYCVVTWYAIRSRFMYRGPSGVFKTFLLLLLCLFSCIFFLRNCVQGRYILRENIFV